MGARFQLSAQPWWVNLLWVVPFLAFAIWRRQRLHLSSAQLIGSAAFAIAFGFVEAAVVVYLRAAVGLLPGYHGTLADVQHMTTDAYQQAQTIRDFPLSLLTMETFREVATIVMLVILPLLTASKLRERWALFIWNFAFWDAAYYAWLWATVRWPSSLKTFDVLFLIPQPWIAQVWFPLAISGLSVLAVVLCKTKPRPHQAPSPHPVISMS